MLQSIIDLASNVLSPEDTIKHVVEMGKGEWKAEIAKVADAAFRSADRMGRLGLLELHGSILERREEVFAEATELALWTMSERSRSLRWACHAPPLRCAGAMSASAEVRNEVAPMMKVEWASVMKINSWAHADVDAGSLAEDAFWTSSKPARLLCFSVRVRPD